MFKHLDVLDEKHVEIVAKATSDDRISCAVQDVWSALSPKKTLYGECLARLTGSDGRIYAASAFVPGLDALRETSMLDRHMVKLVLDLLEADLMGVLECNLSADCLADAAAWNAILDQILDRPHLAQRLVLDVWVAIAFSDSDGHHGFFWGADKRHKAETNALRHCERAGGSDCSIVTTFRNHRHWNDDDGSGFPYYACGALAVVMAPVNGKSLWEPRPRRPGRSRTSVVTGVRSKRRAM